MPARPSQLTVTVEGLHDVGLQALPGGATMVRARAAGGDWTLQAVRSGGG